MPKLYQCITIDTEPDCDIHWKRSDPLTFDSVLYGIPKILRPIWNKYGAQPTYFVSPEVVMDERCCEVLREEVELGAEIGTHLHSEYIEPERKYVIFDGTTSKEYPCFAYSKEVEYHKIKNLTRLIQKRIGIIPVSYRAARYGADLDTIESLIKLDYKVDSSITPHLNWLTQRGPDHSKGIEQPYWISRKDYYKEDKNNKTILEVPITIGKKRFGPLRNVLPDKWIFYSWLRPSHMTVFEMKCLIESYVSKYRNRENVALNMMFHSMEIIPKATPFVRTKIEQKMFLRRLEKVMSYIIKLKVNSVTLKELHGERWKE